MIRHGKSGEWAGGLYYSMNRIAGGRHRRKPLFKVLFDEDNIYVAIRAWDNAPDSIVGD
jgi:hypothetical protein